MSTTKSILNIEETTLTVAVPQLDRADFEEVSSVTSPDGNDRVKVYQYTAGDEDNPMTLQAATYRKPNQGTNGQVVTTYRIDTFAQEVDDSTAEVLWIEPMSVSITVRAPGSSAVIDSADFLALLGNMYTAFFATVDVSNIPETTVVDKLKYNVPAI